jgi:hypothetical protein
MFMTIEEMYAMKEQYSKEILELEMKKAVVDDFIRFVEAKQPVAVEDVCDEEETEVVEEETATDESY